MTIYLCRTQESHTFHNETPEALGVNQAVRITSWPDSGGSGGKFVVSRAGEAYDAHRQSSKSEIPVRLCGIDFNRR